MATINKTALCLPASRTVVMRYFRLLSEVHKTGLGICTLRLVATSLFFAFVCGPSLSAAVIADDIENAATFAVPADEKEYVPGEVLVILADDANKDVGDIEASVGGKIKKQISFPDPAQTRRTHWQTHTHNKQVLRVKLPEGKNVKQAIAELRNKKDPRILKVEPNYRVRLLGVPNDPLFAQLWAMRNTGQTGGRANADIDAVLAWDITTGSDNVIVAVIDTGIDYTHQDLADNMWTNAREIPGNGIDDDRNGFVDDIHGYDFVNDDGDPMDEHSHGTHCSGTIAGRGNNRIGVTGINWQCKVMACRFLDENGSGTTDNAIDAINYAVANGADILSNSWGGGEYSEALAEAISNANDHGVLFVAAAGNDSRNTDLVPNYPSCYNFANVIAVAATDHTDALASFSNYGQHSVHLAAPGVSILSSVLDNAYAKYSGTSMATPHVAGVAALLLAQYPSMSLSELKFRLMWTGDEIDALSSKTITGRRLNAYNALTAQPSLTILTPNTQTTWVQGFDWPIQWISIGGSGTVNIFLLKAGAVVEQLAANVPNTGEFSWSIPSTVAVGSDYRISITDGVSTDESDVNFAVSDTMTDYFTQLFNADTGRFDLSKKSLLLTPDDSSSKYTPCLKAITALPVNPADGTDLGLGDDDSRIVTLSGHSVRFYGESYSRFYVGSNGYITFDSSDRSYSESEVMHFSKKRISAFFRDLNPADGGSVVVKETNDCVVVAWQNIRDYDTGSINTFEVEMFYEGPIRLSWLSVGSKYGMAGLSEGLSTPINFQQSDVSKYAICPPELQSVEIAGPDTVAEESSAQFACIAHYDDDSTQDVSADQTTWNVDSNIAAVNQSGLVTSTDVSAYQQCTISAAYNGKSASHKLIITDNSIHTLTLQKCTVKAGKPTALDSIKCSGVCDVTAEQLDAAENVIVKIYSGADNYLVYQKTIGMNSFVKSKNIYSYKYKVVSGQPGGITSLIFDVGKNTFSLQARNFDLTGLACPVYIVIDLGTYTGIGIANESIVNGSKTIPIQLLSGYSDTLTVISTKPKSSANPSDDRLSIKGTFTVDDDSSVAEGLTIFWGSQTFVIPGDQFSAVNSGRLKAKYVDRNGVSINADFDFVKCTFKIVIKQTTISAQSGIVDFGLVFGNYFMTNEVLL